MKTLIRQLVRHSFAWLACAALAWGASDARAQEGIGDVVYTVGTTTRGAGGRDWAYLLWQATTPSLITGRVFAVYAKIGDATNPAPYIRQSVVQLQTDARVIEPLLRRSENVGEDTVRLHSDMEELFGPLMPTNTIDRAVRLSAVIRGSLSSPNHYQNLLMLARNHPGVSLCLGNASAEMIAPAARTTFEVRAFDPVQEKDLAVVGRVTVEAGNPTVLPQPGPPVLVPDPSPKGDINLKFRWGTPDDLRRFGLMQFGFNLWRVSSAYAVSRGWHVTPPLAVELTNLAVAQPYRVHRVNRLPIIPRKMFTLAEAASVYSPGDTNTLFIADDDGRFLEGYVNYGFTNGATFYYYATARDVLGRDGLASPGLLATVCDRMPPIPPQQVRVFNFYTNNTLVHTQLQALRVYWNQVTNYNLVYSTNATLGKIVTNRSETITNYWIYRWTSVTQMNYRSGNISNNLIAVVPHVPGQLTQNYLDVGPLSPSAPADWNKTYWYTVRAGDVSACGQNLSGNSGPAYGVLRDREGPDAPGAIVQINCLRPLIEYKTREYVAGSPNTNLFAYQLICHRSHPKIEWADFYNVDSSTGIEEYLGRQYFTGGSDTAELWFYQPSAQKRGAYLCRVGASNGKISDKASSGYLAAESRNYHVEVYWEASMVSDPVLMRSEEACHTHEPRDPFTGITIPPVIFWLPSPTSREFRIFRRIDSGPDTLVGQGLLTNVVDWQAFTNDALPVNPCTVCYFIQTLDEHGNPSPKTNVLCFNIAGRVDLPTPVLARVVPQGDLAHPQMKLTWFCPPYGVERFEVWVGDASGAPDLSTNFSDYLTYSNYSVSSLSFTNKGHLTNMPFYVFRTPRVGPGFGYGALFTVPVNITLGRTYAFFVKAMAADDSVGLPSNAEMALWAETNKVEEVPWPARPLVETNGNFNVDARFLSPTNGTSYLDSVYYGNAVLIGRADLAGREIFSANEKLIRIAGVYNPNDYLITNNFSDKIFPVALYRYQVANAEFPTVSGDVVQVSPLMEEIAYGLSGGATIILDPFIDVTSVPNPDDLSRTLIFFWLRDTQPQISGAAYRYLLVRFNSVREIDQIIQTLPVTVP